MHFGEDPVGKSQFSTRNRQITVVHVSRDDEAVSQYRMVRQEGDNLDSKTVGGKREHEESLYNENAKRGGQGPKSVGPERNRARFFTRESRNMLG